MKINLNLIMNFFLYFIFLVVVCFLNSCDPSFGKSNFYFDPKSKNIFASNGITHLYIYVENAETYKYDLYVGKSAFDTVNIEKPQKDYRIERIDYKPYGKRLGTPFQIRPNIKFTIQHSQSGYSAASKRFFSVDYMGKISEIAR